MTYIKEMWVLGHPEWYTHVKGEGYIPTEDAPIEAVAALTKINEYVQNVYKKR